MHKKYKLNLYKVPMKKGIDKREELCYNIISKGEQKRKDFNTFPG